MNIVLTGFMATGKTQISKRLANMLGYNLVDTDAVIEKLKNIKISMQCRGVELDAKRASLMTRLKQTVLILVPLIITSFDRIGNIANAMDLRGFGKKKHRTYYSEHEPTKADNVFKVAYSIIGILCVVYIVYGIIWPREMTVWYPF